MPPSRLGRLPVSLLVARSTKVTSRPLGATRPHSRARVRGIDDPELPPDLVGRGGTHVDRVNGAAGGRRQIDMSLETRPRQALVLRVGDDGRARACCFGPGRDRLGHIRRRQPHREQLGVRHDRAPPPIFTSTVEGIPGTPCHTHRSALIHSNLLIFHDRGTFPGSRPGHPAHAKDPLSETRNRRENAPKLRHRPGPATGREGTPGPASDPISRWCDRSADRPMPV
jgi:hypothetical protein